MGNDSHDILRNVWIRGAITRTILETCQCDLYNFGHRCLRCDQLAIAARLWPIQHQQAVDNVNVWRNLDGIQPG